MRLLSDTGEEPLPLLVVILAALVAQDQVHLAERRGRRPADLAILARPLVVQYAMDGVDGDVLDTIQIWQLRLESMHQVPRGAHDQYTQRLLGGLDGRLKHNSGLAATGRAIDEEKTPAPPLLVFVLKIKKEVEMTQLDTRVDIDVKETKEEV